MEVSTSPELTVAPSREGVDVGARRAAMAFRALGVVTYFLLIFGATVRIFEAGLACPDWPMCFGELVPKMNFQVFLEWGHRALAGMISLGFAGLGAWVLWKPELRARAGALWGFALVVLAVQIVLGGLTVLKLLAYWSVTLHLLTGNAFLIALLAVSEALYPQKLASSRAVRVASTVLMVGWFGQMALGGLVSSNYAGMACTEWPTCNGGVMFPVWDGIVGLQIVHRLGAYTLFGLTVLVAGLARGTEAGRWAMVVLGMVIGQVLLGIGNVMMAMPEPMAIAHSGLGDLIGAVTALGLMRVWRGA